MLEALAPLPSRFCRLDEARRRFGDRVDRLAPWLHVLDPPADRAVAALGELARPAEGPALVDAALAGRRDGVPEALASLIDAARTIPVWVDWQAVDRGGRLFLRAGILGGIVLGAKALIHGYASPGGNKPLMFSGRLHQQAARRLNETARFVQAVCRPGGLRPDGDGFAITIKVRLMHAQVRRMLLASPRWRTDLWGAPINQHDMAATTLLFSLVTLMGLRQLGLHVTRDESDDYMHLWRLAGHLLGVAPELVPATEREAMELVELIASTQGEPDDDSRALVEALLGASDGDPSPVYRERARRIRPIAEGLTRGLLGHAMADALAVPRTPWIYMVPAVRQVVGVVERARRLSPLVEAQLVRVGELYWDTVIARGLAGATADFALPERLGGVPLSAATADPRTRGDQPST